MDLGIEAEWPCYLSLYLSMSIFFYFSENSKRTTQRPGDGGAIVVALPPAGEHTSQAPKPKHEPGSWSGSVVRYGRRV